jgi:D-3-phosphoglycerate dehydrogenase
VHGIEVNGRTIGILGLGRIGAAVARRANALGCSVIAHDAYANPGSAAAHGVRLASLADVVESADFLSLHLPLTPETHGIINRGLLKRMREGAYLVNTARGELIVDEDLVWALDAGHLRGAALDALSPEPPPADHPFLHRDDIILTPHTGAHTVEAAATMGRVALHDLVAVLSGQPPQFAVTPVPAERQ